MVDRVRVMTCFWVLWPSITRITRHTHYEIPCCPSSTSKVNKCLFGVMFLESDANWKHLFEASAAGGNPAAANRPVRQWQTTTMLNLEKAVNRDATQSLCKKQQLRNYLQVCCNWNFIWCLQKNPSTKDVSQSVAVRNPILLGHKVSFICY